MASMTLRDIQVELLKHEARLWAKAIQAAKGNMTALAETLGCSKAHVYSRVRGLKLEKYANAIRVKNGLRPLSVVPVFK